MNATATAENTTTCSFVREGINFGRALAALAPCVGEREARKALYAAARTGGIQALAGRNSGWTIIPGPGRTFTIMQESFILS